jgi:glycerol-3-phosphate acyltransferase PlsY
VWIGKHFYGVDIREHGSKNAGTTNMLRVLGRRAALPVFGIDFLKGFVAVTLSNLVEYLPDVTQNDIYNLKILLVVAVVQGHIFPLFAGFKGGKGVATLAGAVMGVYPPAILMSLAVWVLVLMASHYVSLSSIIAGSSFPVFILISPATNKSISLIVFSFVVAVLLLVTHRKNIARLRAGNESKTYIWRKPPRPDGKTSV